MVKSIPEGTTVSRVRDILACQINKIKSPNVHSLSNIQRIFLLKRMDLAGSVSNVDVAGLSVHLSVHCAILNGHLASVH